MKPEDLMVGDWVLLWGDKPARVDCIGNVEVYLSEPNGQDWRVTYEHIKTIPLTSEILEKNGWKHDTSLERIMHDCKLFIDRERWMLWDSKYHRLTITIRDNKQLSQYNLKELRLDVPCANVHELQHCLKIVGDNKEIQL